MNELMIILIKTNNNNILCVEVSSFVFLKPERLSAREIEGGRRATEEEQKGNAGNAEWN